MAREHVWFVINKIKFVDLNVYAYGYHQCDPGYSFGQTIRDHYVLHFVVSGKGHYTINGKSYDIGKGQCFYIPQNVVHSYFADIRDPWEYYWINFGGLRAETVVAQAGLNIDHPVTEGSDFNMLEEEFTDLFTPETPFSDRTLKILGCTYRIFATLAESSVKQPTGIGQDSKDDLLQIAIDYICKNYSHDINVNKIASQVNIVRSYLYLLFKEKVGVSPSEFLNKVRMEKARELLSESSLNVSEVAYSVGYKDVFLFSRAFKKYHKVNPRDLKHGGRPGTPI